MSKRKKTPQAEQDAVEQRLEDRTTLKVTTVVQFKEHADDAWKEMLEVTTVSKNGAGLTVSRECPVGRIVSLVMQMPPELRLYDHDSELYPMLGVVQNCYKTTVNDKTVYHVGVAFIGKKVPESYKANPRQSYRISGMTDEGLWEAVEATAQFKPRKESRLWRRFEVSLSVRNEKNRTSKKETLMSRDVSRGGMSIWGQIDAKIGDRIKISSKVHDFYSIALVRNITRNEKNASQSIISIEFVGAEFPMEKVLLPFIEGDGNRENADDGNRNFEGYEPISESPAGDDGDGSEKMPDGGSEPEYQDEDVVEEAVTGPEDDPDEASDTKAGEIVRF